MWDIYDGFMANLLFWLTLPTNTAGLQMFRGWHNYVAGKYKLTSANCTGITGYDVAIITGRYTGVVRKISEAAANIINRSSFNCRLFDVLCSEMRSTHSHLLCHTEG